MTMKKGAVLIAAALGAFCLLAGGILLTVGVLSYEAKTVKGDDFRLGNATVQNGLFSDTYRFEYTYVFRDIGPGELEFDIEYDNNLGGLRADVYDGRGNNIKHMEAGYRLTLFRPNYFIYNSTTLSEKDDYTVKVSISDLGAPELFDTNKVYIKVKYKGEHYGLAVFTFILSPCLLVVGGSILLITLVLFVARSVKGRKNMPIKPQVEWAEK